MTRRELCARLHFATDVPTSHEDELRRLAWTLGGALWDRPRCRVQDRRVFSDR